MGAGHNEYITLQSVDLPANRYRIYRITVNLDASDKIYLAKCSWGRVGGFGQSKDFPFQERGELVRFIQSLLLKRKRNGYGIIERSGGFPSCSALEQLPVLGPMNGQLELFADFV